MRHLIFKFIDALPAKLFSIFWGLLTLSAAIWPEAVGEKIEGLLGTEYWPALLTATGSFFAYWALWWSLKVEAKGDTDPMKKDVILSNVTAKNNKGHGVVIKDMDSVQIDNMDASGNSGFGLVIDGADTLSISNSRFGDVEEPSVTPKTSSRLALTAPTLPWIGVRKKK